MTTPSSCKSFFKQYLIYKLRTQWVAFAVSALFNLLTLPLLATDMLMVYNHKADNSYIPDLFYFLTVSVLFVMAATGGARAFRSCVKKDSVDTLAALPLTRREHFIADMLSGYIANVGPFFPCALITMIISVPADNALNDYSIAHGSGPLNGMIVTWLFIMVIVLFLLYTLSYILSVFTTVCCGKMSSSIIFTAVISTLLLIAGGGIGTYAEQCIIGLDSPKNAYLGYIPPFGLLGLTYNNFYFLYKIDFNRNHGYPTLSVWGVILLIIAGAAVTYVSYRVFKSRHAERTGKIMASNILYKVICVLSVIAITSVSVSALYEYRSLWAAVLIALAITAVLVLVLEAFRGLKKVGFIITGTRCLITMAVCVIAMVIVDKTGVFGARYINEAPDNIQSITVRSSGESRFSSIEAPDYYFVQWSGINIEFLDREDIEEFLECHNKTVKKYSNKLSTGYTYQLNIKLKNGEMIRRMYSKNYSKNDSAEAIDELENNVLSLQCYNREASSRFFNTLSSKEGIKAEIKNTFGDVEIPDERLFELRDIFTREFREKYTPSDTQAGIIIYSPHDDKNLAAIDIPSSCTETLEFINSLRGDNSERIAFNFSIRVGAVQIECPVTVKETQTELGRELMSLLSDEYELFKLKGSYPIKVYASDLNRYYVHKDNFNRVFEILMQLIEEKYTAQMQQ